MLITNFASGELSETLFGRIDLPQYFAGAAHIENFDVIPTGGLNRRGGTERLLNIGADGRVIPFLVNRDLGFLLFLSAGKIQVYRVVNGAVNPVEMTVTSIGGNSLYTAQEIEQVQYAQNYDTMVLVHENHPPYEVKYNGQIMTIGKLQLSFKKEIIAGTGITSSDTYFYIKDDELYGSGRLKEQGHYPAAASFFNGRLAFASTKNEPQRLFFSAVKKQGENFNFATNKIFLTEKKEYVIVRGSINPNSNIIVVKDNETPLAFTKNITGYIVESAFFAPGTRIIDIYGDNIVLSSSCTMSSTLSQPEQDALAQWKAAIDSLNGNDDVYPYQFHIGFITNNINGTNVAVYMNIGHTFTKVHASDNSNSLTEYFGLDNFASQTQVNQQQAENQINGILSGYLVSFAKRFNNNNNNNFFAVFPAFSTVLTTIYFYIQDYWIYHLRGNVFTGPPNIIYLQIMQMYSQGADVYIPFYTREIIKDEYPTPDCGFTFEIASDQNDAIRWLTVNKGLIIGTEAAEWIIPPDVHANSVQALLNSRYGSGTIQGTAMGDAACFFQAGGKSLVEYYIPEADNHFRANNMAMLSPQMLSESRVKEFDYTTSPYTKLLITRGDGTMVTLLYERNTGTFAWSRIATDGMIKSAAVLPGSDGNDDVYLLVERSGLYLLEKLRHESKVYLDSYAQWAGSTAGYEDIAAVYDEAENKVYPLTGQLPAASNKRWIGYQYTSRVRSMPILANAKMKQNNIKNLLVRFHKSFMPELKSFPNGRVDIIALDEPYSGVYKTAFPGVWDHDVMFEFIHDKPSPCAILAINAEVN